MSIFQDVTLTYNENSYKIKSNDVMRLIARIESVVTIQDLAKEQGPGLSRLAQAYGLVLRFAGANVTDEEIYSSMFSDGGAESAGNAITGLISLMIPPETKPAKKKTSKKKSS